MAAYIHLSEPDKVQAIRDALILMYKDLILNPAKLKNYIKPEEPAYKLAEDFLIKNGKLNAGCACGGCIDFSVLNSSIPQELEVLIDFAKKEAETKNY
jgi:hypothetical protein